MIVISIPLVTLGSLLSDPSRYKSLRVFYNSEFYDRKNIQRINTSFGLTINSTDNVRFITALAAAAEAAVAAARATATFEPTAAIITC